MSRVMPSLFSAAILAGALLLCGAARAEMATEPDDNTRAVKIIEAPPDTAPPALPDLPPGNPAPIQNAIAPPAAPAAPSIPPAQYETTGKPVDLGPTPSPVIAPPRREVALGSVPTDATINSAALTLDLLPALDVPVGSKVSFRVTSKRPGYLILVDVDANGHVSQIYPAPNLLTETKPGRPSSNYIKPGKPLFIPTPGDGYAGVEYIAAPPAGVAMVVAILSDQPVQIIDLPDVPATLTGQAEALAYLSKYAKDLRIPRGGRAGLQEARWSFDATFYAIR